ncbi:hypothetical protein CN540_24130 [Bacillus toyonensis]|uniref:Uncharacterized protein n=1 Tax=Bacillus toyonensis TaxID=155322 RepID=A0AB36SWX6_9BACI|nr:hypothetical protein CON55_29505 [Bacillus toyonensis]PED88604.1 hypothetical protein CON90_31280 [Bacillus toyonensis]PEL53246.1 hypothetical protein CN633_29780 [Bacillus toyonensis]PEN50125.1 hypothetical protein CN540_24130 [Bacillus toyonensis]PEN67661.1 hypothetical protein CN545_17730 [Bacillus toyonensis]
MKIGCIFHTRTVNITSFLFLWLHAFFIHSYPGAVLGFLFITELSAKLYEILHALSMVFFRNAVETETLLMYKEKTPKVPSSDLNHFNFNNMVLILKTTGIFLGLCK